MFWENEQNSKKENVLSYCKIFLMTSCTLILFLFVVLTVLFSQQEQTDILQMFSVSDCKDYTPTTNEMNEYMFKILMISNIIMSREKRIPDQSSFFIRTPKMKTTIQDIISQEEYLVWEELVGEMDSEIKPIDTFYEQIKLDDYVNKHRIENMIINAYRHPKYVDRNFEFSVHQNIKQLIRNSFPPEFFTEAANLSAAFELLKEYLNYNNCYCRRTNPLVMLISKPSDYKYCRSLSWMMLNNSGSTLFGALIIVITNDLLYRFILLFFRKVSFRSRNTKASAEVIAIALALFFNTLVGSS